MYYKRSYQINFDQNGTLLFAQILVETSTEQYIPQDKMQKAYDYWQGVHDSFRSAAPAGLKNSFQTAMFHWSFIKTEGALISNAYIGISVSLCLSFVVLLIGARNIWMAYYAVFCIASIFLSVMAMFSWFKWEYGNMESIMSIVVLAFVVRFVFLIAYGYLENTFEERHERAAFALKMTGVSVVHSAIATTGSTLFIYLCVALILEKFGTIVCFTELFSVIFSLLVFPSLLYLIGPSGKCGDISSVFSCLCKCKCKKGDDESPSVPADKVSSEPSHDKKSSSDKDSNSKDRDSDKKAKDKNESDSDKKSGSAADSDKKAKAEPSSEKSEEDVE